MKINRNMSAVMTNRNLLRTEKRLSTSMERLSSGYKINRAGDNPAGLAISHKMKSQIDGLDRAKHNTTDAQSVLRIADGALNEAASMLQRIRELCVQAANDTNSLDERSAIQDEIDKLTQEIDRISTDTEYNTKKLLDGSSDVLVISTDVSRVDISDTVLPGNYSMEVTQQAKKAEFTIAGQPAANGTININGITMDVTADMDEPSFYELLRETAEIAGCVTERDGTGYKLTAKEYGSAQMIEIKANAKEQADLTALENAFGLATDDDGDTDDTITVKEITDEDGVTRHIKNVKGKDIKVDLQESEEVTRVTARATKAAVTISKPTVAGTIMVNGTQITADATTMTEDDFFAALQNTGCVVTRVGNGYQLESQGEGVSAEITIAANPADPADLAAMGNALGLIVDATGTGLEPKTVTGDDAQTETTTEQQFSDTATIYSDGLHVKITDLGGFSMEFTINESVNQNVGAPPVPPATTSSAVMVNMRVTDIGAMTIQMGANQYQDMDIRIPEVSARTLYLDKVDVRVSGGPDKALGIMDDAINKLNDVRARIGAFTNRLEYAERSLEETHEDMTSAYSTILDTDMAEAMVEYTQQNVLEQASISVLSQANDIPQQVLSLLQ